MFAARLRAYAPGGASLGLLPDPLSWQASVVHGDLGALTVSYSTLTAGGPLIERPMAEGPDGGLEVAVEVWDGATWVEPRGCRFVRVAQGSDTADDMEVYSITFRSYGWLLMEAPLIAGTFTDGRRVFTAPTAGSLLQTILAENAADDGVPLALIGGGATDAGGAAWPTLPDQGFEYGVDYLGIVRGLQEAGALDWATQARGLYAYLPDSTALSPDVSATVRLRLGLDVGEAPADETIENMLAGIAVRAQAGGTVVVDDPAAPTPWGKWRRLLSVGQVDNQSAAEAMGQAELDRSGRAREQYTRDLVLHDGAPIPLVDYWPGSWITAPTSVPAESVRVQQVTLTFGDGGYGGNVVLNDRLIEGDIRRARTLGTLAGGQIGSGGAPAPVVTDPEASRIPSTPTGLTRSAALTFTGPTPRGVVTASWNAVTTATDTGPLTISGYELQWQIGAGAWQTIFTPELSAQIPNLTPGDSVTVRVRAVGARTTLPSAYATAAAIAVPGDVTAPSVPTGLTVTSALRIVSATWAGTLTAAIPADFDRVEVAAGLTATPTTVVGKLNRAGTLQITGASLGAAIGVTVWVRLRSVDSTGNASAYGTAVSVVVAGVAGPDLAANSVTANTIAVGALDGKLITGSTIRTSATNPRVEMNSTGLFAYNGSGTETISILGTTATITGATIRTGAGTTRLEMTTAGLIAWTSGVAMAEFLPGGLYLRSGGEFVTEYPNTNEAVRIGPLDPDGGPAIRGVQMYDPNGLALFSLTSRDDGTRSNLTLNNLFFTNLLTETFQANTSNNVTLTTVDGTSTPVGQLRLDTSAATLQGGFNANRTEAVMTPTTATIQTVVGSVVQNSIVLDGTNIIETYDGSWRAKPLGTPTWAGGPLSSTVAFYATAGGAFVAYNETTLDGNTFLNSTGNIFRNGSSLRYKVDVEDLQVDKAAVLAMRPRTWRDKGQVDRDPNVTLRIPGFIAEELDALGLHEFVTYEDGVPESIQYGRIPAAQQIVLIDHEARITDALNRIAALETA